MRGIAIRGEVAENGVIGRTGFVAEADVESIIGERIDVRIALARFGTFHGESDFMPLAEFAVEKDVLSRCAGSCGGKQCAEK